MKKLIALTLTLTFTLLLCACTSQRQYTIYTSHMADVSGENDTFRSSLPKNVTLKDISDIDTLFYPSKKTDQYPALEKKLLTLGKEEISLDPGGVYFSSIHECGVEELSKYGVINSYTAETDDAHLTAEICRENELLLFYLRSEKTFLEDTVGDFSKDDATSCANELIAQLYGEKLASDYTYVETRDLDKDGAYSVFYMRYVHGLQSDDTIDVRYDHSGKIVSINASNINFFNDAEKEISKRDIERAENTLLKSISESHEVIGKSIKIGSNGKYLLSVRAVLNKDDKEAPFNTYNEFLININ